MNTKIIFIRHGQSEGNLKRVILGHTDIGLTDLGLAQAESAAKRLKDEHIDCIYSSDLKRAHNTALPHSLIHNLPITDSRELREIFLGDWEGKSVDELLEKEYDGFVIGWKKNFGTYCPPGGESVPHLAQRIYDEVMRIVSLNLGKTILITTHAGAIRAFWGKISGILPEDLAEKLPFPENASINTVIYDGEKLLPVKYSDDAHIVADSLRGESVSKVY